MKIIKYPQKDSWEGIVRRPHLDLSQLNATVNGVLSDIKENGDKAVRKYEEKFDHASLDEIEVTTEEKEEAMSLISKELYDSLVIAHNNIAKFHESQKFDGKKIVTVNGVTCWQKSVPIQKVGLYIPGGTAPLFSTVLMLATPAKIAGCPEIVLCTPPDKEGRVNPAILAAAKIAGVERIFKIGGVQAIGAMAYGTESVPKVYKTFGVCVIADEDSNVEFVAADLLSQAEHGVDSQVILITTSESMLDAVSKEIELQLKKLPRREIAAKTLENSKLVLVHDTDEAIELSNSYAPEHLIIATKDYEQLSEKVVNAGSVFLGKYACESAGDYASGTNHTLPTHRYALAYNGVNLDSYNRKITFQYLTEDGIRSIGQAVVTMAENEQLEGHANAMRLRLKSLK